MWFMRAVRGQGRASLPRSSPRTCALELLAELLEEAERRHRRALAEGADGVAHDVVCDVVEAIELLHRAGSREQLVGDAEEPARAFAAGRALTARLVTVELHQVVEGHHRVGALGHHRRAAGARASCRARGTCRRRAARRGRSCRATRGAVTSRRARSRRPRRGAPGSGAAGMMQKSALSSVMPPPRS